jgi:molybdopterin-guanine dinucleotide biosynthesis protein A
MVEVGGHSLLERALDAVSGAVRTIAVGPRRDLPGPIIWTLEQPPGGGPVAGIDAGLELVREDAVVILGVDFPFVDEACIADLLARFERDGVILRDATGRHQFLVGAYRTAALTDVLDELQPRDTSVRDLIAGLDLVHLDDPRARDCDTWDEVTAADELLREGDRS